MTVATRQADGYFRTVPLHESDDHQSWSEIDRDEVPDLPDTATVGDVTPRSVRYDNGRESWFVDPRDKAVLRAYRERRRDEDIKAGAFPTSKLYYDGKGPL